MRSLLCGLIRFILLVPCGILTVTIVGYVITTRAKEFRATFSPATSHPRSYRSLLLQISGGKILRAESLGFRLTTRVNPRKFGFAEGSDGFVSCQNAARTRALWRFSFQRWEDP